MSRRINLLPPELAKKRRGQQLSSTMAIAGVGLIAVFVMLYVVQVFRLGGERETLEREAQRNGQLRARVAALSDFDDLEDELRSKTELLEELTRNEVRWSVVLADVSLIIPSDVWLTSFTGNVSGATGDEGEVAEEEGAEPSLGDVAMNGTTFSHGDVARWLTRLGNVDGFISPYLSLSTRAQIGDTPVVNFNSTVQLSEKAFRRNQPGAERPL